MSEKFVDENALFNNYIHEIIFPLSMDELGSGSASLADSIGVKAAADSGRRCKSERGQQRPCEIVQKTSLFSPPAHFFPRCLVQAGISGGWEGGWTPG